MPLAPHPAMMGPPKPAMGAKPMNGSVASVFHGLKSGAMAPKPGHKPPPPAMKPPGAPNPAGGNLRPPFGRMAPPIAPPQNPNPNGNF